MTLRVQLDNPGGSSHLSISGLITQAESRLPCKTAFAGSRDEGLGNFGARHKRLQTLRVDLHNLLEKAQLFIVTEIKSNQWFWASLVAQWVGICLPMQGTRVRSLAREDSHMPWSN